MMLKILTILWYHLYETLIFIFYLKLFFLACFKLQVFGSIQLLLKGGSELIPFNPLFTPPLLQPSVDYMSSLETKLSGTFFCEKISRRHWTWEFWLKIVQIISQESKLLKTYWLKTGSMRSDKSSTLKVRWGSGQCNRGIFLTLDFDQCQAPNEDQKTNVWTAGSYVEGQL